MQSKPHSPKKLILVSSLAALFLVGGPHLLGSLGFMQYYDPYADYALEIDQTLEELLMAQEQDAAEALYGMEKPAEYEYDDYAQQINPMVEEVMSYYSMEEGSSSEETMYMAAMETMPSSSSSSSSSMDMEMSSSSSEESSSSMGMSSSSAESSESSEPECPPKEHWNGYFCVCNDGLERRPGATECTCKQNKMWDEASQSCTCPPPREEYPSTGYCGCPSIYMDYDPDTNTCNCSGGKVWNAETQSCECPYPSKMKGGKCRCPDGEDIQDPNGQVCACPDGADYNPFTNECVCSGGRELYEEEHQDLWECRCPDRGQRWHEASGECKNVHSVDVRLPMLFSLLRGNITSADGNIDCNPSGDWQDCYQLYWEGSDVTLTYNNPTEYMFKKWDLGQGLTDSGPCDCEPEDEETCTISNISRSQRCKATLSHIKKDEVAE